jgi:hypothetical protein
LSKSYASRRHSLRINHQRIAAGDGIVHDNNFFGALVVGQAEAGKCGVTQ